MIWDWYVDEEYRECIGWLIYIKNAPVIRMNADLTEGFKYNAKVRSRGPLWEGYFMSQLSDLESTHAHPYLELWEEI